MVRRKAPAAAKPKQTVDGSVFKDLADVIRAKSIFFVPFFGAFLAFLVGKSDVVLAGGWFFKIVCALTFFLGIAYASVVSQLLWALETLRFITNVEKHSEGACTLWVEQGEPSASKPKLTLKDNLLRSIDWENRLYRWVMWLLYFMAMNALVEMYLRATFIEPALKWLVLRFSQ